MKDTKEMLELYQQAEIKILQGKSFEMNGRKLGYEDLSLVVTERKNLERKLIRQKRKNKRVSLAGFYE